jgi:hypothetical protein
MRGCWYFGPELVRLTAERVVAVQGVRGPVAGVFQILGCEVMAQQGYLEEVWSPEAEALGLAAPWPVVDIRDDGQVVARRVKIGIFRGPAPKAVHFPVTVNEDARDQPPKLAAHQKSARG